MAVLNSCWWWFRRWQNDATATDDYFFDGGDAGKEICCYGLYCPPPPPSHTHQQHNNHSCPPGMAKVWFKNKSTGNWSNLLKFYYSLDVFFSSLYCYWCSLPEQQRFRWLSCPLSFVIVSLLPINCLCALTNVWISGNCWFKSKNLFEIFFSVEALNKKGIHEWIRTSPILAEINFQRNVGIGVEKVKKWNVFFLRKM